MVSRQEGRRNRHRALLRGCQRDSRDHILFLGVSLSSTGMKHYHLS
jgi:hypothetical protein